MTTEKLQDKIQWLDAGMCYLEGKKFITVDNIEQKLSDLKKELKTGKIGNITHRNSCGEPIKDEYGKTIICCGDDLGGLDDEFAQCERCRFNDFIDEAFDKHIGLGSED